MIIYIGVGAIEAQALSVQVLKYTILKHNPEHEIIIESVGDTEEFKQISKRLDLSYGTVFSLHRFLVPQIAKRYHADICMHLDSDMLCMRSLDPFFEMIVNNANKIILPLPNPDFEQPQQTAVFGCVVAPWTIELFNSNLTKFLEKEINYVELMRLSFSADKIFSCSHIYNSREQIDNDTVIFHLTDLYRQPWVNQFNALEQVWLNELSGAIAANNNVLKTLNKAVESNYCLPSLARLSGEKVRFSFLKDLFFMAPQFDAYGQLKFGRLYKTAPFSWLLRLGVIIWVQSVAIWHAAIKYKKI